MDSQIHMRNVAKELEQEPAPASTPCYDQFFTFSHIRALFTSDQYKHDPQYEKYIKEDILKGLKGEPVFDAIRRIQKKGLIILLIFSIIVGLMSLVGPLLQGYLVQELLSNNRQNLSTYFALITVFIVLKSIIFNYIVTLANNIAVNVKLYISNAIIKTLFYHSGHYSLHKIEGHRTCFYEIDTIKEFISIIPYFIVSCILLLGVSVFIAATNGAIGLIVLGVFLFTFIFQFAICKLTQKQYEERRTKNIERTMTTATIVGELLKLSYRRIAQVFRSSLIEQRTEECKHSRNISLMYTISQWFTSVFIVVTLIIYFGLAKDPNQNSVTIQQAYLVSVYLATLYLPYKVLVYSQYIILQATITMRNISQTLEEFGIEKKKSDNANHMFIENIGNFYNYKIQLNENQMQEEANNMELKIDAKSSLPLEHSCIVILGKIQATRKMRNCFRELLEYSFQRQSQGRFKFADIQTNPFIIEGTVRENILYYLPYEQKKYKEILQLTELQKHIKKTGDDFRVNFRYLKPFHWYALRIELARALYNDVQILILRVPLIFSDINLLKNIIEYRRKRDKKTIIFNNTSICLRQADYLIVYDENGIKEKGQPAQLLDDEGSYLHEMKLKYQILKNSCENHDEEELQSLKQIRSQKTISSQSFIPILDPIDESEPPQIKRSTYFRFYNLVHSCAALIILLALVFPAFFNLYLNIVKGNSVASAAESVFNRYLSAGLVFLLFIFLKGIVLSIYLEKSTENLVTKIFDKLISLKAPQILTLYHEKQFISLEGHIQKIDRNLTMDFQLGISFIIDNLFSLILIIMANVVFLAIALPIMILTIIITAAFLNKFRASRVNRLPIQSQLFRFIFYNVKFSKSVMGYQKESDAYDDYLKRILQQAEADTTENMYLSGCQILGQIVTVLSLIIVTVVFINIELKTKEEIGLIGLGIGFLIGLSNSYRMSLKIYRTLEVQLISVTQCMNILEEQPLPILENLNKQRIESVQAIEFKDFSIQIGETYCKNISLSLKKTDRISVSGGRFSGKQLIFYSLAKVFREQDLKGSIFVNGRPFNSINLSTIAVLNASPFYPNMVKTVENALTLFNPNVSRKEMEVGLKNLWKIAKTKQFFNLQTEIDTLTPGQKEMLEFCRVAILSQCKVLLIIEGLGSVDTMTRMSLTQYLVKKSDIDIVVQVSNRKEIVEIYPRNIVFRKGQLIFDSSKQEQ